MPTQCSCDLFGYEEVEGREVVACLVAVVSRGWWKLAEAA
jgi:hypothetical protein